MPPNYNRSRSYLESDLGLEAVFQANLEEISGILTLVQEWAGAHGVGSSDRGSLRLILEELLLNIHIHGYDPENLHNSAINPINDSPNPSPGDFSVDQVRTRRIELTASFLPLPQHQSEYGSLGNLAVAWEDIGKTIYIQVRDNGKPFNPTLKQAVEVGSNPQNTALGGRGLYFVNLLATQLGYRRYHGQNILSLAFPLQEGDDQENCDYSGKLPRRTRFWLWLRNYRRGDLYRAWHSSLSARQTLFLGVIAVFFVVLGLLVFDKIIRYEDEKAFTQFGMQIIRSLDLSTSRYMRRFEDGLFALAEALGQRQGLSEHLLGTAVHLPLGSLAEQKPALSLLTEFAAEAIIYTDQSRAEVWMLTLENGQLKQTTLSATFAPIWFSGSQQPAPYDWQGQMPDMPAGFAAGQGAILMALPWEMEAGIGSNRIATGTSLQNLAGETLNSQDLRQRGMVGVLVFMPLVLNYLKQLSGLENSEAFIMNNKGEYLTFPPGRSRQKDHLDIFTEAKAFASPALRELGEAVIRGRQGLTLITPAGEPDSLPWELPWAGPTAALYSPMRLQNWYLCILTPSQLLGQPRNIFASYFPLLVIIGGTLALLLLVWRIVSNTVKPIREGALVLEKMAAGDLEHPVPDSPMNDEISSMFRSFERSRLALRTTMLSLSHQHAFQERLANELVFARAIQESMLPQKLPALPNLDIAARICMAQDVYGDFYDCFFSGDTSDSADQALDEEAASPLPGTRLCFVVGDVSGTGIPAALLMASTISLTKAVLQEGLSPAEALARVNIALLRHDNAAMFVTMLIGVFDPVSGDFCWANAGHPAPIQALAQSAHTNKNTGAQESASATQFAVKELPTAGELALGILPGQTYTGYSGRLKSGEALILYTDGATEVTRTTQTTPPQGEEMYGEARLGASLLKHLAEPDAQRLLDNMQSDIFAFMDGKAPQDDITLLVIRKF